MQFSTFALSLATVLSVILAVNSAAITNTKRDVSNIATCSSSIDTVGNQLAILRASVLEGGVLNVNHDYNVFEDAMNTAQSSCCSINQVVSDADAKTLLTSLGNTTPKALNALSTVTSKRPDYNFISRMFIRSHIRTFQSKTSSLNSCYSLFIPAVNATVEQGYFDQIQGALNSTLAAYN